MTGDHRERGGHPSVGHRHTGGGRCGDRGRDARDDLERDAGLHQRQRFLATAAEHEGVAALEAHDPPALAGELHEERGDQLLRHWTAWALADVDQLDAFGDEGQHAVADEGVVDDDVGLGEQPGGLQGQQIRIAGTGADERNSRPRSTTTELRHAGAPAATGSARRRRTWGSGSHVAMASVPTPADQSPNVDPWPSRA
jgi:hypothetical protein